MRRSDASGGSGGPGGRADASLGRAVVEISRGSRSRSRLTLDETPRLLEGAEATGCLVGGDAEGVAEHLAAREATVGARGGGVGGVRGCLGGGGRGLARDGRAETPGGYHPGADGRYSCLNDSRRTDEGPRRERSRLWRRRRSTTPPARASRTADIDARRRGGSSLRRNLPRGA